MNKKSTAASIILAAMAAPLLVGCNSGSGDAVDNVSLVPVKVSKDKWSFVDPNGNILFEDEFKNEPTAVYNDCFSVQENEKYTLYKVSGDKYDVLGDLDGLKQVGYMEEGLVPVSFPKQRITVYESNGKKKFELSPVNGQEVVWSAAGFSEGMLPFTVEDGKMGYYDKDGKVAIKPVYDHASMFGEGLAVVAKTNESTDETTYSVINKKGETVFKLKSGQSPKVDGGMPAYSDGYMIVRDDDRDILYDTKGEAVKFPAKISHIISTNGKYVIYANEDYECGVAKMDGETVIRAKYGHIEFDGTDTFMAFKDDECLILDNEGKEISKYDFERMAPFGKFGYFAYDGSRWSLVDKEGKQKGKEDFYDVGGDRTHFLRIYTDYFDVNAIAKKIAELVSANGVGEYKLGATAQSLASGSPSDYTYRTQIALDKLDQEGFRYEFSAYGYFSDYMARSDWDYYTYEYSYSWNPDSKLVSVAINLETESEWGKPGLEATISEFKAKGFNVDKQGYMGDNPAALLSKGNMVVFTLAAADSGRANFTLFDKTLEDGKSAYNEVKSEITKEKNGMREEVAEAVDSAWVEAEAPAEVAVVEETPAW